MLCITPACFNIFFYYGPYFGELWECTWFTEIVLLVCTYSTAHKQRRVWSVRPAQVSCSFLMCSSYGCMCMLVHAGKILHVGFFAVFSLTSSFDWPLIYLKAVATDDSL